MFYEYIFFIIALTWLHFVYFTEPKHNKCQMYQMPLPKLNDDMYARLNSEGAMVSKTDVVVYSTMSEHLNEPTRSPDGIIVHVAPQMFFKTIVFTDPINILTDAVSTKNTVKAINLEISRFWLAGYLKWYQYRGND